MSRLDARKWSKGNSPQPRRGDRCPASSILSVGSSECRPSDRVWSKTIDSGTASVHDFRGLKRSVFSASGSALNRGFWYSRTPGAFLFAYHPLTIRGLLIGCDESLLLQISACGL